MVRTRSVDVIIKEDDKGKRKKDAGGSSSGKRIKMSASGGKSMKKEWSYLISPRNWFPGKITITSIQSVITHFVMKFTPAQREILENTCLSYYMHCREIAVQPQLIHYMLLREVKQPNNQEMWFNIDGRYIRFSMAEFCLVTGLRYDGVDGRPKLDDKPSAVKETYFKDLKVVTSEDVKRVFLSLDDAPDLDVVKIGIIYLITSYLFATPYPKVVEQYIFALVDDFATLGMFPWGRYLFETTLSSLRKGLSKQTSHYRLMGFLVAFQVWLYECIPALEGNVATRICKKYPRIMNWTAHKHPSVAMLEDRVFGSENVVINDIDPSEVELMMPYMTDLQYSKPRQPNQNTGNSKTPVGKSESTPPVSKVHIRDSDDDFVDPPLQKQTGAASSSSPAQSHPVYHPDCSCVSECGRLKQLMDEEITKLQVDNKGLKEELLSMKSELSDMNDKRRHSNSFSKLDELIRSQNGLKDDLNDIRSTLKSFVESVSDILSSVIDEVQTKLSGKDGSTEQEPKDDDVVDRKGKGHMEPKPKGDNVVEEKEKGSMAPESSHCFHDDCVLEPPSFDLGVGYSQSPKSSDDAFFASKEMQESVDDAIARALESTQSHIEDEDTPAPPSSGLPLKRAQKPSKNLQSPFVKVDARYPATGSKSSSGNVVFQIHSKGVDSADVSAFQNWFHRGYKPKNREKFSVQDNVINPKIVCGNVPVHQKTWWHTLTNSDSSLSSTHMDACFHYIRQLAKFGEGVKMKATTTDCIFDLTIRTLYSKFVKDPSIVNEKDVLLKTINGERLSFNTCWREVESVLMPIMPTNHAHWMLGQLDINNRILYIFNSSNKSYKDYKVREGVLPLVKTLTHLLKVVGLWMKTTDDIGDISSDLHIDIVSGLPQQQNAHDCGVFVIKYAQYLLHNDLAKMPMSFDTANARLEIAALLFKNREQRQVERGKSKSDD